MFKCQLIILFMIVSCSNNPQPPKPQNIKGPGDIYYTPIGKDETGCTYYNSFAPGQLTIMALYYRKADGSFTNLRNEADCDK